MTFYKLFLIYTLIFGFILTICSFLLTPKVKDTTNRAENSANGVQVLGVSLFCISATILFCGGSEEVSPRKKMLLIAFILVFSIIIITLVSIVHTDCEDARKITPVLLGFGVFSLVLSLVLFGRTIYQKRKGSIPSDGIEMVAPAGAVPAGPVPAGDSKIATRGGTVPTSAGDAKSVTHSGPVPTSAGDAKSVTHSGPVPTSAGDVKSVTHSGPVPTSAGDVKSVTHSGPVPTSAGDAKIATSTGAVPADKGVTRPGAVPADKVSTPGGTPVNFPDLSKLSQEQTEKCKELLDAYKQCLDKNTGTSVASASATHSTRLRGG
jgi:hypothetical protein